MQITIDISEFMIMPVGALNFREKYLRMGAEVFHSLKSVF